MKKRSKTSGVVLASAITILPLAGAPALLAQRPAIQRPLTDLAVKFAAKYEKWPADLKLVGINNGATVYQDSRNQLFTLDPATGDQKFLAAQEYARFTDQGTRAGTRAPLILTKWRADKFGAQLAIVGIDAAGHVVNRNARGEKFYLDPATGDMVFVK